MGLVSLLFSFKGRINRQQYWFGGTGVGFAGAMLIFAVVMMTAPLPGAEKTHASPLSFLLMLPIVLAMGWAGLAIQWKRFHDRNQPGWISLLPLVLLWSLGQAIIGSIFSQQPMLEVANAMQSHMMIMSLINFAFFINLGCLNGTDGPNKYGDLPRWWGEKNGGSPSPSPSAPQPKAPQSAMPAFLNSSLGNAASAIDRAIAEGPATLQPATATATPTPSAPSSFGRAPSSGGGFGKKR